MIPYDFEYHRPASAQQAVQLFHQLEEEGKNPLYYAGGTEIISLARVNQIQTKAVIDIKGIPECHVLEIAGQQLMIGACVPLTRLEEENLFPLLTKTSQGSADHTSRNKITLGGNILSTLMYRETLLPFLLADSEAVIVDQTGERSVPVSEIANGSSRLKRGELLIRLVTDEGYLALPHATLRKTRLERVDYPLVMVAALKKDERIRVAFSGVCSFPFRSEAVEEKLNAKDLSAQERITQAINHLPGPVLDDMRGSADYRGFVLQNTLTDLLSQLEGAVT